jgi:hypothetical protein
MKFLFYPQAFMLEDLEFFSPLSIVGKLGILPTLQHLGW